MAKIELSINVNYLPKWGAWEGIRELVQNGKDAETEHGATLTIKHKRGEAMRIENEGVTLTKEALLFGTTSKAGRSDTIGKFGEGLKLGVLALVRKGYGIVIKTGDEIWTPKLEKSDKYDATVLVFHIRKTNKYRNYVGVEIDNVDEETWDKLRPQFLFLTKLGKKEHIPTKRGSLLLGEAFRGKIFVKGIYVQTDTQLKYGYDFTDVEVDRDRKMVGGYDQRTQSALIWSEAVAARPDLMDPFWDLVMANDADVSYLEHYASSADKSVADHAVSRFKQAFGESAVPVSNIGESADVEHLGKRGVVVSKALGALLQESLGTQEAMLTELRNEVTRKLSWSDLSVTARVHLKEAVEIISKERTSMSLDLVDVVEFRSPTLFGQYKDGRLLIASSILETSMSETLATLVHEWCHSTGAADGDKQRVMDIETLWRDIVRRMRGWVS